MNFGPIVKVKSLALTKDLPDLLYPSSGDPSVPDDPYKRILTDIVRILEPVIHTFPKGYSLLFVKEAMEAFTTYADEVYSQSRKEATGLHVGYYFHDPDDPEVKVAVPVTFIEAHGDATTVTCEMSYEETGAASLYCEEHHLRILVWIHSHPGFGVFYSLTDGKTLRTQFNAEQHAGVVVDNLHGLYLAYKIIDDRQETLPILGFSLTECRRDGVLKTFEYREQSSAKKMPPLDMGKVGGTDQPEGKGAPIPPEVAPVSVEPAAPEALLHRLDAIETLLTEIKALLIARMAEKSGKGGQEEVVNPVPKEPPSRPPYLWLLLFVVLTFCYSSTMTFFLFRFL